MMSTFQVLVTNSTPDPCSLYDSDQDITDSSQCSVEYIEISGDLIEEINDDDVIGVYSDENIGTHENVQGLKGFSTMDLNITQEIKAKVKNTRNQRTAKKKSGRKAISVGSGNKRGPYKKKPPQRNRRQVSVVVYKDDSDESDSEVGLNDNAVEVKPMNGTVF